MIIFMDGPDHYGENASLLLNGVYADAAVTLTNNTGPGGQGCTFGSDGGGSLRKVLPGQRDLVAIGQRLYYPSLPVIEQRIMTWNDISNNIYVTLSILTTGALKLSVADDGVTKTVYQSEPVIVAQSWQHVECRVETGGQYVKYAIGVDSIVIAESDLFVTVDEIPQTAQVVVFYGNNFFKRMRDLYIWDSTGTLNNSGMQGDRQVITTYPTADTAVDDWVPSAGASGWPLISNVPPDDAEFITANAEDLISEFEFGDIDTDITSISAIMLVARVWKSDAGLATVKLRVTSGGETDESLDKAMSTNKVFYNQVFETDPDTDVKWTPTGVNAVTPGLERTQ